MFDYEDFEKKLVICMEKILTKWRKENTDIYIFALDLARGADSIGAIANTNHYLEEKADKVSPDYYLFKYCEDEWELFEAFEDISKEMRRYIDDNRDTFSNPKTYEYTKAFDEHCDKIIESCKNALISFVKEYPKLLFAFNIRDYLDGDERIEIFEKLNGEQAAKEYAEHIDEFV